jgi:hypothetical protein
MGGEEATCEAVITSDDDGLRGAREEALEGVMELRGRGDELLWQIAQGVWGFRIGALVDDSGDHARRLGERVEMTRA